MPGSERPEQGVDHQSYGDDRQCRADAAPRRLQQHHDHDRAHHPVERVGVADAELQVMEDPGHVEARQHGRGRQHPVVQADAERREETGPARRLVGAAARREDEEDQAQHEGDVNAAVGGLGQQAEAGGVVVEAGEREQETGDDPPGRRQQRAELHLRIELGLELLQVGRQMRQRVRLRHACGLSAAANAPSPLWGEDARP